MDKTSSKKDTGIHKWIVLLWVVFLSATYLGTASSFGSLFVAMLDKYKEGRSKTAVMQSLFVGFSVTPGVLTGLLVSRFGVVKVTIAGSILTPMGFIMSFFADSIIFMDICIGAIAGFGVSFVFISGTVTLGNAFSGPQRKLAMALQTTFISVGIVLMPYLNELLLESYGLNGTCLVLAGIFLNSFPAAIVFHFEESNVYNNESTNTASHLGSVSDADDSTVDTLGIHNGDDNNKRTLVSRIVTYASKLFTIPYMLLLVGSGLIISSSNAFLIMIVDVFVWKGYSIQEGVSSFVSYGICAIIGNLITGLLALKKNIDSAISPIIFCFSGSVGLILVYVSEEYYQMAIGTGLFGFAIGGVLSSGTVIIVDILGDERRIGVAVGMLFTTIGILTACIGPFYGYVRDSTGSYSGVLLIATGIQGAGITIYIIIIVLKRRLSQSNDNDTVTNGNI